MLILYVPFIILVGVSLLRQLKAGRISPRRAVLIFALLIASITLVEFGFATRNALVAWIGAGLLICFLCLLIFSVVQPVIKEVKRLL